MYDIKDWSGEVDPDFKDVKLKFRASGALKALAVYVLKVPREEVFTYKQVEVERKYYPEEYGFAPFALAVTPDAPKTGGWGKTWPNMIEYHIRHWHVLPNARKYATDDVKYTRMLHQYFSDRQGKPLEAGDDDSELAWMVASNRWHGYAIDIPKIRELRKEAAYRAGIFDALETRTPKKIPKAPKQVRAYLSEVMTELEQLVIRESTKKVLLEEVATWEEDSTPCPVCGSSEHNEEVAKGQLQCINEEVHGVNYPQFKAQLKQPAIRASEVLDSRKAKKETEIYDKLLLARRFHADFDVIGALSSRMSGGGSSGIESGGKSRSGLNAQGIQHQKFVRRAFPLADSVETLAMGMQLPVEEIEKLIHDLAVAISNLCGGDFKSYEVSIAEVVFADPAISEILRSGKKVHAELGTMYFPNMTPEEIAATDGQDPDYYDKSKKADFALFYGGTGYTLANRLGVPREVGDVAYGKILVRFQGIGREARVVEQEFSSITQPGGIGTAITYRTPADYVESFLGFRRYFTLENRIIKVLFELAQNLPPAMKAIKIKVQRRERLQTASGAVSSALYACAFAIQQAIIRAAKNHKIQSPGATMTKGVQRVIWDIQPAGVHPRLVQPMNTHDEIMNPTKPGYEAIVTQIVQNKVAEYRKKVPFLAIDWIEGMDNWSEKSGKKKPTLEKVA